MALGRAIESMQCTHACALTPHVSLFVTYLLPVLKTTGLNGTSFSKKWRWFYQPQSASSRFSRTPANRTPANRTLARLRLIGD